MKSVLIIGGGLGGLSAICGLRKVDNTCTITLIEPKEYMEIHFASYRSPFEEWVAKGSLVVLEKFCKDNNVVHVRSLVTKLTSTQATLSNGDTVKFDIGVVAVGAASKWAALGRGPREFTREERLAELKDEGAKILNSGHVVVVGGGLIGTETAGDIAGYAKKAGKEIKVTLVHSGEYLCNVDFAPAPAQKLQEKLENLGVEVILNERATQTDGKVILKSGREIESNMTIMTIGNSPINSILSTFDGALDSSGWIVTDEFFRIKGQTANKRLFSIGDCTTTLPNSANQMMQNAGIIGINLKAALDGKEDAAMKKFVLGPTIICNTVGPDDGIFVTPWMWTQYVFTRLKNKTMFFFSPRFQLGLKIEN